MYVAFYVLLILHVACAQSPSPSAPSPTASNATDANPWQNLLEKMIQLMQAAGPPGCPDCVGQKTDPAGNPQSPVPQQGPQDNTIPVQLQTRPPPPPTTTKPAPVIADCFWEGRYYKPGSDIVRGQHDRWCYVTYCDNFGKIQFWDDYNCPPNSMKPTSGHNKGRGAPSPNEPPQGSFAGASAGVSAGGNAAQGTSGGCTHKGMTYTAGQEISSHRVGERCYGVYCSHDSKVVNWEDWCTEPTTKPPTLPPKNAGGVGGSRGGGGGGRGGGSGGRGNAGGGGRGSGGNGRRGGGSGAGRRGGGAGGRGGGGRGGGAGGGQVGGRGGNRRGGRLRGCYHNAMYYQPNEDVIVGNIGDLCYGYYCEGANTFVHWEDQCANNPSVNAAPTPTAPIQPSAGLFFK